LEDWCHYGQAFFCYANFRLSFFHSQPYSPANVASTTDSVSKILVALMFGLLEVMQVRASALFLACTKNSAVPSCSVQEDWRTIMLSAIVFTVLFGLVWGCLWGALEALFIIKGFLDSPQPITQIIRGFLCMLISSFATGLLLGGGGGGILTIFVAIVVSIYARPWVISKWQS